MMVVMMMVIVMMMTAMAVMTMVVVIVVMVAMVVMVVMVMAMICCCRETGLSQRCSLLMSKMQGHMISDSCGVRTHALTEWRLEPPP